MLAPGPLNAITDVEGVLVGQTTLIAEDSVRTGATAILPHGGNLYQDKVPAAVFVFNGFGKSTGLSQVAELGEIETPIVLTNTLSVATGMEAILDWTLAQPGNEKVMSVNAVVGETNDGYLNDIRRRALTSAQVLEAIKSARAGLVEEGAVGAGNGSGDYVIAFSTARDGQRKAVKRAGIAQFAEMPNDNVSPLFQAVAEATEEAIYNSLLMASTTRSRNAATGKEIVVERVPLAPFLKGGKLSCHSPPG